MSTTILLADDHVILRDGLRAIIESEADLKIVGQASNGKEAVDLADKLVPDLILMDIGMKDLNGVDATRRILTANPRARVIALSAYGDRQFVLAMLGAGACGYVLKSAAGEELLRAIRAVLANRKYLSPEVAGTVVDSYTGQLWQRPARDILTDREREVVQLVSEGKSSQQIAAALHIAEATVNVHRRNISKKLNLHTVAELTRYAIREGLSAV